MTERNIPEFFRGMALVLADLVRVGQVHLAREIIEPYDLCYGDFASSADMADLIELQEVLPPCEMTVTPIDPERSCMARTVTPVRGMMRGDVLRDDDLDVPLRIPPAGG